MTELLEKTIERLRTLPEEKQNAIAALVMAELDDEVQWDTAFAKSQDVLADLAAEAMAEFRAGQTQTLDPEKL